MTSTLKAVFGKPIWNDENMSTKGTVASAVLGAGAGFGAYKLTKGIAESSAKCFLATKDNFVKRAVSEAEKYMTSHIGKDGYTEETVKQMIKDNMESWTKSAKESFNTLKNSGEETLSACKKAKIKYIAAATLVGVGLYKIIKDIKNKDKAEVKPASEVKL